MKRKFTALKITVGGSIAAILAISLLVNLITLKSVSAQGGSGEGSRKPPAAPSKGTATPRRPSRSTPRGETRTRQGSAPNSADLSALARADRARDYLINVRGIDAGRIQIIDGGFRADATFDLFICPIGVTPPAPKLGALLLNLNGFSPVLLGHHGRFLLQDITTGAFEGRVVDQNGAPIAGAMVQCINQQTGVPAAKRTDADGRFYQSLLQPGIYTIRISKPGFKTIEVERRLMGSQNNRVIPTPLVLEPESNSSGSTPNQAGADLAGTRCTRLVVPKKSDPAVVEKCPRIRGRGVKAGQSLSNQPPAVTLAASRIIITRPCSPGSTSDSCTPDSAQVQLATNATDPDGDNLEYTYSTTGGRVVGNGSSASWDLTGLPPGTYTATVAVSDGCGCAAQSIATVSVQECTGCISEAERLRIETRRCPTITVFCQTAIEVGTPLTFTTSITGDSPEYGPTYNWSVSTGTIISGQGTPAITVNTAGHPGSAITATVALARVPANCFNISASCTTQVSTPQTCRMFDEYGAISFEDEKARLNNFAIRLQNEPGTRAYIYAFNGRKK